MNTRMFFSNLTFFRFPVSMKAALAELEARLDECTRSSRSVQLEMSSRGFVAPMGREAEALVHGVGDCRLGDGGRRGQDPARRGGQRHGRQVAPRRWRSATVSKLGGRARKRLKDEILHELLPTRLRASGAHQRHRSISSTGLHARWTARQPQVCREPGRRKLRHGAGQLPGVAAQCRGGAAQHPDQLAGRRAAARGPVELGEECELK
jgi:recombination associated protein RdgC